VSSMSSPREKKGLLEAMGRRIQAVKERLGLNQSSFARQLGVSQSFLSQVAAGKRKPSFELLYSLFTRFGVDLPWILTGAGEMFSQQHRESRFAEQFPGVPLEEEVMDLVKSLAVPIMKNALLEKYFLYRKRYEDIMDDYFAGKKKEKGRGQVVY
jgi:transcriptional regulator with XRE-family HTH domain